MNPPENRLRTVLVLSFLLALFVAIWLRSPDILSWYFGIERDWERLAPAGDAFGFINALFSGVALIGILVSIVLQRKELEATRDELRKTAAAQKIVSEASTTERNLSMASTYATILQKMGASLRASYSGAVPGQDFESDPRVVSKEAIKRYQVLARLCTHLDVAADAIEYMHTHVEDASLRYACINLIRSDIDEWISNWVRKAMDPWERLESWLPRHFVASPKSFSAASVQEELATMRLRYERYQKFVFAEPSLMAKLPSKAA